MSEIAVANNLAAALTRSAVSNIDQGDVPFLRLLKSGEWVYGADDIDIQTGSLWAVNPQSFSEGYINWGDGELLGEEMTAMVGTPIILGDLPIIAGSQRGWQKQLGFQLLCLNGEDEGTQVLFKSSSKGGIKAIRTLMTTVVAQIAVDPANIVPVMPLSQGSYKHKTYGRIYFPVFEVKEWTPMNNTAPVVDVDLAAVEVAVAADVAEVAATPDPVAAKPTKRRRPVAS